MSEVDPAFASFDRHVLLSGYSGAMIGIVKHGQQVFVRKVARSVRGNKGLVRQQERQVMLQALSLGDVRVPEVLGHGHVEGRYYFDMAYVPGRDAATFLGASSFDEVRSFTDRVVGVVEGLAAAEPGPGKAANGRAFEAKLDQIRSRTEGRYDLSRLGSLVLRVPDDAWPGASSGMHGDLTLENILVDHDGGLWLIDSIDGPFEHYWQDIAKLCQDLEGHWHRHRGRAISTSVTAWLRRQLLARAEALHQGYRLVHYPLLALTFARILPYATDAAAAAFVYERVAAFTRAGHLVLDRELT